MKTCSRCDKKVVARGLCASHYNKARYAGEFDTRPTRQYHYLSNVDIEGRTATCAACGPVEEIHPNGPARCPNKARERRGGANWSPTPEQREHHLTVKRERSRRKMYGPLGGLDLLMELCGGRCELCHVEFDGSIRFHVDHDHSCCGRGSYCKHCTRGVLCGPCNQGLGQLKDDPEILRRGIEYLTDRSIATRVARFIPEE